MTQYDKRFSLTTVEITAWESDKNIADICMHNRTEMKLRLCGINIEYTGVNNDACVWL